MIAGTDIWMRCNLTLLEDLQGRHLGILCFEEMSFREFDLPHDATVDDIYDGLERVIARSQWHGADVIGFHFRLDILAWAVLIEHPMFPKREGTGRLPGYRVFHDRTEEL